MIDRDVFAEVWAKLCRRFGRKVDPAEISDYLGYLDGSGLTTEAFVAAAEAVWATREFFPRPADFLAGESLTGWRALCELATTNQYEPEKIIAARSKVPPRAFKALTAIGGTDLIREARDLSYVRREYLSAYEAQVQEEAMGLERRLPTEQPEPAYLRTTGGKPQRVLAALPVQTDRETA
jgi:hypothetical protein